MDRGPPGQSSPGVWVVDATHADAPCHEEQQGSRDEKNPLQSRVSFKKTFFYL